MTVSKDLMLALLSMDSYNRGYGAGMELTGAALGNATILNVPIPSGSQAVGFYASAYTLTAAVGTLASGSKIISYRGTNTDSLGTAASDVFNGWVTGAGIAYTQAQLADNFYASVTGLR